LPDGPCSNDSPLPAHYCGTIFQTIQVLHKYAFYHQESELLETSPDVGLIKILSLPSAMLDMWWVLSKFLRNQLT
jgi:hypothetical protein